MKRILTISFIIITLSFRFQGQDNELHAFELDHTGVYPVKDLSGNPLFTNINISNEATPQNEPSVRISRTDPNIVVAAWRDFRLGWEEPDVVRRIGYSYSHDGGLTWSESQLLPDPLPNHLSQSDPVLTSDASGHFYLSSTSRQPVANYNRDMLLYKSTDDGQTFQLHATAVPGSGIQGEDKEWIFCDPVETNPTYDNIMIAWRSFGPSYGIKFRKSDVGGSNWGETKHISDNFSGQGANLATGTDGSIHIVWWGSGVMYDRSLDGGENFGTDVNISNYSTQSNNSFPFICVDYSDKPSRGNIYVAFADRRSGMDDVYFQRSTDGGDTWLAEPILVNDETLNHQYWPAIQCDENGRIVIVYYDEREGPGQMNAYLAYSDNQGDTWTNMRLSDETFPGARPNTNVRFGDYIHIDTYDGKVIAVWTDDRTGDYNQEIYTALVDLPVKIKEPGLNADSKLLRNYPNPFSEGTMISFELPESSHVKIEIFNASGQLLDMPVNNHMEAGKHQINWASTDNTTGLLVLKLTTDNAVSYLKMTKI